jgi:hypothetical protein
MRGDRQPSPIGIDEAVVLLENLIQSGVERMGGCGEFDLRAAIPSG